MARKRRRSAWDKAKPKPEPHLGGTEETVAKLRPDIIEQLYRSGRIDGLHRQAAHEIRTVWEAMGRGLFPFPTEVSLGSPCEITPFDRMTEDELAMWQRHYLPWAKRMSFAIVGSPVRVTTLQLVLDVALDDYPTQVVAGWYELSRPRVHRMLRDSLQAYAEIAGWA